MRRERREQNLHCNHGKTEKSEGRPREKELGLGKGLDSFLKLASISSFVQLHQNLRVHPPGLKSAPEARLFHVLNSDSYAFWARRVPEARLDAYLKRASTRTEARPDAHWSAPANSFTDAQIVGQNRNLISILHYEW